MQTEKIYHYTSIASLGLILSSKNIRFARLDTVDDVTEAQTHEGVEFGRYFFVSCWTQEDVESIAQWKMYGGDMSGVRIELPVKPFRQIKLESIPGYTVDTSREYLSPLSTKELFGKSYLITPMMPYGDDSFQGRVEYVPDVGARWAAAVSRTPDPSGLRTPSLQINKMYDLVRLKSRIWAFQSEYRFFMHVMPMVPPFEADGTNIPTVKQMLSTSTAMQQNVDPGVKYIDVPIDSTALDKMVIRAGPLCTLAEHIAIEALVAKLAPKAVIEPSHLTGMIRGRGK
jgi:hypothetical protein